MARQLPDIPAELREVFERLISEDDVARAVDTLKAALNAKVNVRQGQGRYGLVEDWRSRIVAAKLLIEFRHGKAAQKVEHSGKVDHAHLHATPEQILDQAGKRYGATAKIVQEYLDDGMPSAVQLPQTAATESVPIDLEP